MKKNLTFISFLISIFALNLDASAQAQITNPAYITTNILFSLHGQKTPGPQSEFKSNEKIVWALLGVSTNRVWYRHFPDGNFDFHLFDEHGQEVLKTKAGLSFSSTPIKPTLEELSDSKKYIGYSVDNKQGEYRYLFRPDEMFVMTNRGIYNLKVKINLCVIMTNDLPDLKAMTDARNVTGHGFKFVKDFGVLTSLPVQVQIIKE